jgi:hypothetical protein
MWLAAGIIIFLQFEIMKTLYNSKASISSHAGFCVYKMVCFRASLFAAFCVFFAIESIILISRTKGWDEHSMIVGLSYAGLILASDFILFSIKILEKATIQKNGQNSNSSIDGSNSSMPNRRLHILGLRGDEDQY